MNTIIKRTLQDRRWAIAAFCMGGLGLVFLYASIFPSIQQQSQAFQQAFKSLPKGLSKAFGIDSSIYTSFEGYVGVELFSITWPVITLFLVISAAGNAIAGDVERRTMGLLLASPLSRTRIFWSKYAAGIIMFGIFVCFSLLSLFPVAALLGIHTHAGNFLRLTLLATIFGLAAYSIAMLFSVLFSERGKVYSATAALFMLMYVANIIASLQDKVSWLKYGSFFYYFNYAEILRGASPSRRSIVVFVGATVICSVAGWQIFKKRDLAI